MSILETKELRKIYGSGDTEVKALDGVNLSVENGEFVLMDFGAVWNGYHSDMTRTVCVGEPTDEMKKVYNIVLEAQLACLEKAKGGMSGSELDNIARSFDLFIFEGFVPLQQ